jgi:hypothetical protein
VLQRLGDQHSRNRVATRRFGRCIGTARSNGFLVIHGRASILSSRHTMPRSPPNALNCPRAARSGVDERAA